MDAKEHKRPAYLKLNPLGDDPGPHRRRRAAHGDGGAPTAGLRARRQRQARLSPGEPGRAQFLQVHTYLANTVQPAFRQWFSPEEAAGPEYIEAGRAKGRQKVETCWTHFDSLFADGRQFFAGDRLSAADFLGTMLARWSRNMPKPATTWPNVGAYLKRMKAMRSLKEVHAREGLTDWIGDVGGAITRACCRRTEEWAARRRFANRGRDRRSDRPE